MRYPATSARPTCKLSPTPPPPTPQPSFTSPSLATFPFSPPPLLHSMNVTFDESIGAFIPGFPGWFTVVLFLFGAFHLFFSLWMLIEYFLINWRNFVLPQFFYYPIARYVCACQPGGRRVCVCVCGVVVDCVAKWLKHLTVNQKITGSSLTSFTTGERK